MRVAAAAVANVLVMVFLRMRNRDSLSGVVDRAGLRPATPCGVLGRETPAHVRMMRGRINDTRDRCPGGGGDWAASQVTHGGCHRHEEPPRRGTRVTSRGGVGEHIAAIEPCSSRPGGRT